MTNKMTVAFGNMPCEIYDESGRYYISRKQIGEALGYENPSISIATLHRRNHERLDALCIRGKKNSIYYTLRGAMEICRFSNSPKANEFMDFVWDIMESISKPANVVQSTTPAVNVLDALTQTVAQLTAVAQTLADLHKMNMSGMNMGGNFPAPQPAPVVSVIDDSSLIDNCVAVVESEDENAKPIEVVVVTPPAPRSAAEIWHDNIYAMLKEIYIRNPDDFKSVVEAREYVCNYMKNTYGWVREQARKDYAQEHKLAEKENVDPVDLFYERGSWQNIFESSVKHIMNTYGMPDEAVMNRPVPADRVDAIIYALASKIGYVHKNLAPVFRKVYVEMGDIDWEKWYKRTDLTGHHHTTYKRVVLNTHERVFNQFRKAAIRVAQKHQEQKQNSNKEENHV